MSNQITLHLLTLVCTASATNQSKARNYGALSSVSTITHSPFPLSLAKHGFAVRPSDVRNEEKLLFLLSHTCGHNNACVKCGCGKPFLLVPTYCVVPAREAPLLIEKNREGMMSDDDRLCTNSPGFSRKRVTKKLYLQYISTFF